jgi:hypothetical protein
MFSALSQAWRSSKGAKGVAALAAVAFAVGLGTASAIYTVVNAVMLKPLPFMAVSPGYFRTMRVPLVSGRFLDERDTREDPLLAVINEAAARVYWPAQNPVGAPTGGQGRGFTTGVHDESSTRGFRTRVQHGVQNGGSTRGSKRGFRRA